MEEDPDSFQPPKTEKKVKDSSVVVRSMLALSSSKQTPARSRITTYRAGRLMSGDREKPIPQQLKAVFARRCSPFDTAEEGRTHRKFGKKKCEGKTIRNPVSMDSCHELVCPHRTGTALRPGYRHILGSFPFPR